ncbi:MAG: 16S rRNA (uracil(1498)-N(3))-methyltransferase [Coxiellaceae bacterium]|jgi:16S rRNA (uracil1498-N3)-methyltransferase|nr:16S rRNA (uracil(1498)-N(3))-methyltransferase [Coxiellaceae bacterium]
MRLRTNSPLVLFNGTGGEYQATLIDIVKHHAVVSIDEFTVRYNESSLSIHLGQGISRGEKMDFTIKKAVELGVSTITPLFTEYYNIKLIGNRLKKRLTHWQNISISAAEQSGRCCVPKVLLCQGLTSWCNDRTYGLQLVLDPSSTNKLGDIKDRPSYITVLVGPKGGLSNNEVTYVKQNHFLPISLGPRILRTETAAMVAISILQAKWGDL